MDLSLILRATDAAKAGSLALPVHQLPPAGPAFEVADGVERFGVWGHTRTLVSGETPKKGRKKLNTQTLKLLSKYLNRAELAGIRKNVAEVNDLELTYRRRLARLFHDLTELIISRIEQGMPLELPKNAFEQVYMELLVGVSERGFRSASSTAPSAVATAPVMMAGRRAGNPFPSNLGELMHLWDVYRKTGKPPKRVKVLAERVRKAYLKKVQSVFEKHSEAFRGGQALDRFQAKAEIMSASRAPYSRAKMIVETETTFYYNQARRQVYDKSDDVTHYLFVAIRDSATTHWCRTRNGLVYKKGSAILDRETPPIHWNCRSELLPLTAHNPRHLQLIQDKHLWRELRHPAALPSGWNRDRVAA